MKLDRVTITGADPSVSPGDLVKLSAEYPWVEWGILVSQSSEGTPRFPPVWWTEDLLAATGQGTVRLALHICGRWVRQIMLGQDDMFREWGVEIYTPRFHRVQFNFHAKPHTVDRVKAALLIRSMMSTQQIIVQMDNTGNEDVMLSLRMVGIDAVPLYDTSGGAGVLPEVWPDSSRFEGIYQGYAGGLGPDTLAAQLPRIAEAAGDARVWIDMERRVRSEDDTRFDLDRVRRSLDLCAPFVTHG